LGEPDAPFREGFLYIHELSLLLIVTAKAKKEKKERLEFLPRNRIEEFTAKLNRGRPLRGQSERKSVRSKAGKIVY
jgi:hypothetical protein